MSHPLRMLRQTAESGAQRWLSPSRAVDRRRRAGRAAPFPTERAMVTSIETFTLACMVGAAQDERPGRTTNLPRSRWDAR